MTVAGQPTLSDLTVWSLERWHTQTLHCESPLSREESTNYPHMCGDPLIFRDNNYRVRNYRTQPTCIRTVKHIATLSAIA